VSLLLGGNPIVSLPTSFLSCIPKLRVLELSGGEFQNLPEELGDLKHLVCLDLSNCANLEALPDAVGKLHMLKCLYLHDCLMLEYLPYGVVGLTSLQVLNTSGCEILSWAEHMCVKMTPSGIARTESLGHEEPAMGASLDDICGLVALTRLSICGSFEELPHKIFALPKLKELMLEAIDFENLAAEMPHVFIQLQELCLPSFFTYEYLPRSFTCCGAFPALVRLEIMDWSDLVEFPEVDEGAFPKLQTLDLSYCDSLGSFPEVPKGAFPKLRTLDLSYCKSLGSLPLSLEVLTTLRKLISKGCKDALKDSCRTNCEKSVIWGMFDIQD